MNALRKMIAVFAMMTGIVAGGIAAASETNVSGGLTLKGAGLAVHGYDVVAYFTKGRPTLGHAKYSAVYKGATYRFATRDHLDRFKASPAKYAPQYGGYCAFGVSVGAKFDGDPRLWRIVDGKLYLNLNPKIQKSWEKNIPRNITKADRNWKRIAKKTPAELS